MARKENKLIAEFMGIETDENGMYRYTTSVDDYTTDDLSYFEYSWDWLMPVVEKIDDMFGEDEWVRVGYNRVHNAVLTFDINQVYGQVVDFINEYNKNK